MRWYKESTNADGRVVGEHKITCDAYGCKMFAARVDSPNGYVEFGGYVSIKHASITGHVSEKHYCMSCYTRSEGFGI